MSLVEQNSSDQFDAICNSVTILLNVLPTFLTLRGYSSPWIPIRHLLSASHNPYSPDTFDNLVFLLAVYLPFGLLLVGLGKFSLLLTSCFAYLCAPTVGTILFVWLHLTTSQRFSKVWLRTWIVSTVDLPCLNPFWYSPINCCLMTNEHTF